MAGDVPPVGHFGLPLNTNTGTIPQVTADYKRDSLEYYLNRKGDRPERHALRHLLGVLAFQQGQRDLARQHFDRILSEGEDPGNLNARANLDHVNTVVTSGNDLPDLETEDGKRRQARRYAEQGFAFMFDLYDETVTHERYRQARDLYVKAMELAGILVDHKEREDWLFGIGLANLKIFSIPGTMSDEAKKAALDLAVENFQAILTSAQADNAMKCDAWFGLAQAVKKAHKLRQKITVENLTQQACLDKALEVSPDKSMEARILARKASICYYAYPRNDFQEAIHLLKRSIELDSSKINFFAYSKRASIYVNEYESSHNVDLLHSARADLEHILKEHVSPLDFEMLAKVYFYLANSTTQEEESKAYIRKALQNCTNGEECHDGKNIVSLQKLREQIQSFDGHRGCYGEHRGGQRSRSFCHCMRPAYLRATPSGHGPASARPSGGCPGGQFQRGSSCAQRRPFKCFDGHRGCYGEHRGGQRSRYGQRRTTSVGRGATHPGHSPTSARPSGGCRGGQF